MKNITFISSLPKASLLGAESLVIYDKVLPKVSKDFKKWLKDFDLSYPVEAGEELKSVDAFPGHIHKIAQLCEKASVRHLKIVVVGGGSVGDFGGFVASVLKRGVGLVHIPSTWLAAVDSAHGGKTALNVGAAKNQIGTFYPAEKIYIVESLLSSQPSFRAFDAFGELLKIALINGGPLWNRLSKESNIDNKVIWNYLKSAIQGKYLIVQKDPLEKKGLRHLLNLGHTVGHTLETLHDLPHGVAINYGMDFALRWSVERKIMKAKVYEDLSEKPVMAFLLSPLRDDLFSTNAKFLAQIRKKLLSDKKKDSQSTVRFIFVKEPGKCVIESVAVDDILIEICRQIEEEKLG